MSMALRSTISTSGQINKSLRLQRFHVPISADIWLCDTNAPLPVTPLLIGELPGASSTVALVSLTFVVAILWISTTPSAATPH
jgi:hypothetical protein